MIPEVLLGVVGWGGSALLVVSILQSNLTRLRVLNLASRIVLVAYNAVLSAWPMAAMNAALLVINAVYLLRSRRAVAQSDPRSEPSSVC